LRDAKRDAHASRAHVDRVAVLRHERCEGCPAGSTCALGRPVVAREGVFECLPVVIMHGISKAGSGPTTQRSGPFKGSKGAASSDRSVTGVSDRCAAGTHLATVALFLARGSPVTSTSPPMLSWSTRRLHDVARLHIVPACELLVVRAEPVDALGVRAQQLRRGRRLNNNGRRWRSCGIGGSCGDGRRLAFYRLLG